MLAKLKSLGPGLLYAGAAIGVSHLVQSTQAGAAYGYILIVAIVLAHIFKYPFFVLGPRYAAATGTSLVSGYAKMGKWAIVLLAVITLFTMFSVQAAVTLVTVGLIQKMTHVDLAVPLLSAILLVFCFLLLQIGKFNILDNLMKVIMLILSVSTVAAFILSFGVDVAESVASAKVFNLKNEEDLSFLLAFVGWMPAPLDIAIWHSIWALSGPKKTTGEFDFKLGFYGTAILGICFLMLGANTMYGSGIQLQSSSLDFASQLVDIFTLSLGSWSYWFIMVAAATTMFSTTLTCYDAMPRVMSSITAELGLSGPIVHTRFWQIILLGGSVWILTFMVSSMGQMISFATILSFLAAPILAWLSYRLVITHSEMSLWSTRETVLARVGIAVLLVFSLIYAISLF